MVPVIGVLALQGDVREHLAVLAGCAVVARPVRRPGELAEVDGLVLPGGESTTMSRLLETFELLEPLRARLAAGMPAFGSCAGLILLARTALDGRADQHQLGALDVVVRRNAFGRQVDSFETDLPVVGLPDPPVRAVFIRAPWIEEVGPGVEVLAVVPDVAPARGAAGRIVAVRQGCVLATAFHPELTGEGRMHRLFCEMVRHEMVRDPVRAAPAAGSPGTHGHGGSADEWPLEMGDHQAQEGGCRRPARQAVREADQEHRGGGPDRWR